MVVANIFRSIDSLATIVDDFTSLVESLLLEGKSHCRRSLKCVGHDAYVDASEVLTSANLNHGFQPQKISEDIVITMRLKRCLKACRYTVVPPMVRVY